MEGIQSPGELREWLVARGIDISKWGTGAAKTVDDLWNEIQREEIYLQDDPPLRIVNAVQVIVRRESSMLVELKQEFEDGRVRFRNHPPAEKMKPSEHCEDAAIRCLQEELGVERSAIEIDKGTDRQAREVKESPSYPGLNTQYTFHVVAARVKGLPDDDFETEEDTHNEAEAVRKHQWGWRKQSANS
jgi:ADP-ribose pyrophosphatase YjhB (NUDIX family)